MSKAYLLLIGALVIVALGIGTFAYLRSTANPSSTLPAYGPTAPTPSQPSQPSQPASNLPPAVNPAQNEITLTVSSPTSGQVLSSSTVTVTGRTSPNADVAVNDQDVVADASGNFSATVNLDEGDNEIVATASNDAGQSSEWSGIVTYTPSQ